MSDKTESPFITREHRGSTDFDDVYFGSGNRQQFIIDALTNALRRENSSDGVDTTELREELLHWVQETARREPKRIGGILLPIVGPMIRQMITDRLQAFMENTTAMLDMYASPMGLKLRLQSLRTGVPLSRLILLNMFVFRVDSVMLIHSKTSMVVQDFHRGQKPMVDADAIGAMLTAISKFIDDSFGFEDGVPIKDIRLGDYHVWLFSGPIVNLACVVYGRPDTRSRRQIVSVLEDIHAIAGPSLRDYPNTELDKKQLEMLMRRCLVERRDQEESSQSKGDRYDDSSASKDGGRLRTLGIIVGLFFVGLLAYQFQDYRWNSRVAEVESLLSQVPGIAPLKVIRDGKSLEITALVDNNATLPLDEIDQIGFPANRVTVVSKPYVSRQ